MLTFGPIRMHLTDKGWGASFSGDGIGGGGCMRGA